MAMDGESTERNEPPAGIAAAIALAAQLQDRCRRDLRRSYMGRDCHRSYMDGD